jgi:pyruvate kinase
MDRRTKIVATIGPASDDATTLGRMTAAGMDMARLSLAHGPVSEFLGRLERIRHAAAEAGRFVGVLADLPGPKIRSGSFPEGGVYLTEGDSIDLVVGDGEMTSDWNQISVDHPDLLSSLRPGDRIAIGDGGTALLVEDVQEDRTVARVLAGGRLQGRPGVSPPPNRLNLETPTAEDLRLLEAVCAAGVDAVAISFVRSASDVQRVRAAVGPGGPMLVAKIETQEAVDDVEQIISVSDGVMVARGDLGIRCALEDVPHYQKSIIRTGVAYGRPVITATQMLESMVHAPTPTRAEVSDVANAVFDGTSALMLSGETAIGHDPVAAIVAMATIAARAEQDFDYQGWGRSLGRQQQQGAEGSPAHVRITAAISAAAWRAAGDSEATAIIACTNTGATARAISRFRPSIPILAVTPSETTARQLSVAWGITPVLSQRHGSSDDITWFAVRAAVDLCVVKAGDVVAVLVGSPGEPDPTTDILRLVRVR